MKVEQAKQIASKAIEELSQALETGHSETLREHLAAMARFHRYSLAQRHAHRIAEATASHVAGFHAWHKLGRFVKKGEKGILILAPIIRRKAENNMKPKPTNRQRLSDSARPTYSISPKLTASPSGNRQRQWRSSRVS